ncbi:MAG TPA: response regulator [Chthoniobacteraceae bacterium]|nr:response regulator [Chthoniobacteraceae bacterium]
MRILLVENHEDTRKYMAMFLEGIGHRVSTAATMREALRAAPESDCDVLLSDIGLPDGDGWELLKKARFSHPVYAIAMSGFGTIRDEEKSREAGFRRHLLKPIPIEKLEEALEEAARTLDLTQGTKGR